MGRSIFVRGLLFRGLACGLSISLNAFADVANYPVEDNDLYLEQVVVTSTREEKQLSLLPESVGVLDEEALKNISPAHPADALNRIAGVHINNLGGEGHMASIRQPITTSGVYLFLEDGLPTRPSGFFNHNGLYEINIPQSSRVEVIKGPASALYGSDAIGGVINVLTKPAPIGLELNTNAELGSDKWRRGLISLGGGSEKLAARLDLNATESEGFRDEADYDRQSVTLRLDSQMSPNLSAKVVSAFSTINQSGVSSLEEDDYRNNTQKNRYHDDIGFREVDAFRLFSQFDFAMSDSQLLTFTPYYRDNKMVMMPSWMVTYDPNIREYEFESFGAQVKYRQFFFDENVEMIVGVDLDSTPSSYFEEEISVTLIDDIYENYARTGSVNYHFDAEQQSISPYAHAEFQVSDAWRVSLGARYDKFEVDYENFLPQDPSDFSHRRPESQKITYENTSPKLGVTYQYSSQHSMYLSHRYAFRAPTVGSLFRPGSSQNTTDLEPVTSVSSEIGFRGSFASRVQYEMAYYDMKVEDDIVSIIDDGSRNTVNAGETRHQGLELGVDWKLGESLALGVSYTHTDQSYEDFSYVFFSRDCFCNQEINFAGNDVARAPKNLTNIRVAYTPTYLEGLRLELEWDSVGDYFTDQTNTQRYAGHDLINLRASYEASRDLSFYIRVANLGDELYSTYTSNQVNDPDLSYRPGMPRSVFAGVRWSMQ